MESAGAEGEGRHSTRGKPHVNRHPGLGMGGLGIGIEFALTDLPYSH